MRTETATLFCRAMGCQVRAEVRGYCRRHYGRVYRTGSPYRKPKQTACRICGAKARSKGLCGKHYAQERRRRAVSVDKDAAELPVEVEILRSYG